jgi:sortase A
MVFLIFVGSLLSGVGLTVSLFAITGNAAPIEPTLSPFDQSDDDIIVPEKGSAPIIVSTLRPNIIDQKTPEPSPTYQVLTGQEKAALMVAQTGTPTPMWFPTRLEIPEIELDAPIVSASIRTVEYLGRSYPQWKVPNLFAAGWASTSATLGVTGNTVLFGHHNIKGEVFAHLVDLQEKDLIFVYSGKKKFAYSIALKMILPERNEPVEIRMQNALWLLPSDDERLTLLTCWPYTSNSHRLIIVAVPTIVDDMDTYSFTPRLTPLGP